MNSEIVFLVEEDPDGGYTARAIGQSIFTQADNTDELRRMVRDAVACHYPDEADRPRIIRLHFVRDEVLSA
ncbi:MAG: 2-oxoisovalerate dehydrogenase E1 subunit beta [Planctomycetota bacterium]